LWRGGPCGEVKIGVSVWTVCWEQKKTGCCRKVATSGGLTVVSVAGDKN